jgi:hypothetical protein
VDPKAGLDHMEERKFLTLPGLEFRPLGRPAGSQSLVPVYWINLIFENFRERNVSAPLVSFKLAFQQLKIKWKVNPARVIGQILVFMSPYCHMNE